MPKPLNLSQTRTTRSRRIRRHLRFVESILFACLVLASPLGISSDIAPGIQAYRSGDFALALQIFEPAAARGDPDAQFSLGVLYFEGKAKPQDLAQSKSWFLAAARQGHVRAQFNLGNAYMFGRGVAVDREKATHWWRKAAFKGSPNACHNLATYYIEHGETAAERELGIAWLRAASERGWKTAQANLRKIGEPLYGEPPEKDWQREPLRSEARLLTIDPQAFTVQLYSGSTLASAKTFMEGAGLSDKAYLYRLPRGGDLL